MDSLKKLNTETVKWKSIKNDGLNLEYAIAIPRDVADELFVEFENCLQYFTGDLAKVK